MAHFVFGKGIELCESQRHRIALHSLLGIRSANKAAYLLQLPSGNQYLNHFGTVHAGAQLALAEASSGEFLFKYFGSSDGLVPILRRMEAKFRNLANGRIMSTASATSESLARLDAELASKGRSIIGITVEIYDESGAYTLLNV